MVFSDSFAFFTSWPVSWAHLAMRQAKIAKLLIARPYRREDEVMNAWLPDQLLTGFQAQTWEITGAKHYGTEPTDPLTATLVRHSAPKHGRALLYLHGWSDYFFQRHIADWFDAQGFDFYAVDLRRYGRNLRKGLYAGYIENLRDYFQELDHCVELIRGDYPGSPITFMGHSTGGLAGSLWASERQGLLSGLILNSAWLDMHGSRAYLGTVKTLVNAMSHVGPYNEVKIDDPTELYVRATHVSTGGEWTWDLDRRLSPAFIPRFGWVKAIMAGQAAIARGLHIDTPILTLTSTRSDFSRPWNEGMRYADIVLDVHRIGAAAVRLGDMMMLRRICDAMHDVFLSAKPVRDVAFDELGRWLDSYVLAAGVSPLYRERLGDPAAMPMPEDALRAAKDNIDPA